MRINRAAARIQLLQPRQSANSGEKRVVGERDPRPRDLGVRIWTGEVRMADDFDELPSRFLEHFAGQDN